MRIAVVGSRDYPKKRIVEYVLSRFFDDGDELVSGGARGVDTWAANWARAHKHKVTVFEPDWEKHGRKAGMLRNTDIVENCDMLLAFWDGKSKGTMDSYRKAQKAQKVVMLSVWSDEPLDF